jgi:hypothetical protein
MHKENVSSRTAPQKPVEGVNTPFHPTPAVAIITLPEGDLSPPFGVAQECQSKHAPIFHPAFARYFIQRDQESGG